MQVQTRPNVMFTVAFGKVWLLDFLMLLLLDMFWAAEERRTHKNWNHFIDPLFYSLTFNELTIKNEQEFVVSLVSIGY